jgi:diguanylate cyclase (GGDEF)-like protein
MPGSPRSHRDTHHHHTGSGDEGDYGGQAMHVRHATVRLAARPVREDAGVDPERERAILERLGRLETENAELRERLAAVARTDELTGLPNRRAWDQELLRETSRANRRDQALAVVRLDLDRLGAFNDERGAQAGDALLRETGAMWRLALRTSDFIARYEDDEFAVLLPDCPPVQAVMVLERLLAYLPSGQTCSAGIAHRRGTEPGVALLARAGEALGQAKAAGGNRAITATDPG